MIKAKKIKPIDLKIMLDNLTKINKKNKGMGSK